jgi:RNase P/RNase MRP subunit p30
MIDIVMPKDNEDAMIAMAKRLHVKELIFLYTEMQSLPRSKPKDDSITIKTGYLVKDSEFNKIQRYKQAVDYLFAQPSRQAFETKAIDYVFDMEIQERKDSMHHRNSGLNQVLCTLAKKNNITICINFNNLLKANNKGLILGRMLQNITLFKKYKNAYLIASFARSEWEMRNPKDMASMQFL